jgi:hypothetical protein
MNEEPSYPAKFGLVLVDFFTKVFEKDPLNRITL